MHHTDSLHIQMHMHGPVPARLYTQAGRSAACQLMKPRISCLHSSSGKALRRAACTAARLHASVGLCDRGQPPHPSQRCPAATRVRACVCAPLLRRFQYEEEVSRNPLNYDTWFDYIKVRQKIGLPQSGGLPPLLLPACMHA